jgi:hypothetical protein
MGQYRSILLNMGSTDFDDLHLLYTSKWAVWNDAWPSFRNECYAGVQLNSCLSATLLELND